MQNGSRVTGLNCWPPAPADPDLMKPWANPILDSPRLKWLNLRTESINRQPISKGQDDSEWDSAGKFNGTGGKGNDGKRRDVRSLSASRRFGHSERGIWQPCGAVREVPGRSENLWSAEELPASSARGCKWGRKATHRARGEEELREIWLHGAIALPSERWADRSRTVNGERNNR
jgi:hypothetical protein